MNGVLSIFDFETEISIVSSPNVINSKINFVEAVLIEFLFQKIEIVYPMPVNVRTEKLINGHRYIS